MYVHTIMYRRTIIWFATPPLGRCFCGHEEGVWVLRPAAIRGGACCCGWPHVRRRYVVVSVTWLPRAAGVCLRRAPPRLARAGEARPGVAMRGSVRMGMEHGASAGIRRRSACRRPKGAMAPCGEGEEIGATPSGPDVREESLVVVCV